VWFQFGPPGSEPGQKRPIFFRSVVGGRTNGSHTVSQEKSSLTNLGGEGRGVGEWGIFLRVCVTFVRQNSTAFIRFGE
jgi:hypothetical protein